MDDQAVVVMQDGGVLMGNIAREGDRYVLTRAGGEILIPAASVLLVAKSLDDAYIERRKQIVRPTAQAHLALAEWCLRHGLVVPAKRELDAARALDAGNLRLPLLERRLAVASAEPRVVRPTASAASPETAPAEPSESPDPTFNALPASVVERFTRKVQPVLVNNCTASGCHHPGGAQEFQLDRALLRGLANRRTTMNNLSATLALVDCERPELSPLLTIPRRTHGGMERPVFGPRQEQAFRHLVDWVALVTQKPSPAAQTPEGEIEPAAPEMPDNGVAQLISPIYRLPMKNAGPASANAADAHQGESEAIPTAYNDAAEYPPLVAPPLRIGAQMQKWQPRDPFDPEIFNRRHRMKQSPPAANFDNVAPKAR